MQRKQQQGFGGGSGNGCWNRSVTAEGAAGLQPQPAKSEVPRRFLGALGLVQPADRGERWAFGMTWLDGWSNGAFIRQHATAAEVAESLRRLAHDIERDDAARVQAAVRLDAVERGDAAPAAAGPWPAALTAAQVRTLVVAAFDAGAAAGSQDPLGVDLRAVSLERDVAVEVALAAIEAGPFVPPVGCAAVQGGTHTWHMVIRHGEFVERCSRCGDTRKPPPDKAALHEWEYGHSASGLHRKCAKCGCWDTQEAAGRPCDE